jgi:hypothetical protein
MEPDPRVREALGALDDGSQGLDSAAVERIARTVAERGPAEIARGRNAIVAKRSAAVFLAAAAAVVLGTLTAGDDAAPVASVTPAPATTPRPPMCATRSVGESARFAPTTGGAAALDLGTRALVTRSPGAVVEIGALSPCELVLALGEGTVTVDARDLGGGTLAVDTPEARVTVRGTRFDVRRSGQVTDVRVEEGIVEVAASGSTIELRAGERVRATADTLERDAPAWESATSAVPPPDASEEALPPAERRPALDAESLATRGAAHERTGDLDAARADYRAAMTMRGLAAEAACLSLARLELGAGRHTAARAALRTHRARFARGSLAVEAAWLAVQVERAADQPDAARVIAERLVRDHGGTAQARAARSWLSSENDREDER